MLSRHMSVFPTVALSFAFAALGAIRVSAAGPSREPLQPAFSTGTVAAVTGALRVVTYNIENFGDGVGDKGRTPEIAAAHARDAAALIAGLDPDLIVLQEIENAKALALLNSALPRPYPTGYVTDFRPRSGRIGDHNVAILSRVSVADVVERDFGAMTGDIIPTRGFLRCTVPLPGDRRLVVYGTHLKSNFGRRDRNLAQRRIAMEAIRGDADEVLRGPGAAQTEVLLAGDMNTDPDSREFANDPTLDAFRDWIDLWRGRPLAERGTCPTRVGDPTRVFPPAAFDRILVAPAMTNRPWVVVSPPRLLAEGVNTKDVYALPGTGRGHVSDHYPVAVDLAP
ncbi:MAG: endonuclease/exonuclease/phosphatase family protein [Verrucomicrobia bacterium]|nr:endonuclease/exonuclease/phosphatase family protein [Verrucomicrobiota bacterium]